MTAAWGGIASGRPPYVTVGIRPERYTYRGILDNMSFSVNVPSKDIANEVDLCGKESGRDIDKAVACNFKLYYGKTSCAPLISQCPVNLECVAEHILSLGSHSLIVGRVEEAFISEDCLTNGQPDILKIQPIIFAPGGEGYHYCGIGSPITTHWEFKPGPPPRK
jgi:flavin reductase (DIM6/NTAB) family NADH-FMN oxidoreductase RutF